MKRSSSPSPSGKKPRSRPKLYTLQVFLLESMTKPFAKQKGAVPRTIQIRGDQTLEHLHCAIYRAYDRDDEHLYEFQFGQRPHDPQGKRYVLPMSYGGSDPLEADLTRARIGSLGLEVRQAFGYWFDFGDDWWHGVRVLAIDDEVPPGKYPKITEKVGKSPPQYPTEEEEEDEEGEKEEEEE